MAAQRFDNWCSLMTRETSNRNKNTLLITLCESIRKHPEVLGDPAHAASLKGLMVLLRRILCDYEYVIRTQALRALRYVLNSALLPVTASQIHTELPYVLQLVFQLNIDLLMLGCFERENKTNTWERLQAFKLIECFIQISNKYPFCSVSHSVFMSLIAVASHGKDRLQMNALDGLRNIMLSKSAYSTHPLTPKRCVLSDLYAYGVKAMVDKIISHADGQHPEELLPIILTLLHLYDRVETRQILGSGAADILKLLSVLTETRTETNSEAKEKRRSLSHYCIVTMMRSWTGTLLLVSDPRCVPAFVRLLGLTSTSKGASWARESIFEMLFEIISVVDCAGLAREMRRRERVERKLLWCSSAKDSHKLDVYKRSTVNLLHNYIVFVLLTFIETDLFQTLTKLSMSVDDEFRPLALRLLRAVLFLASHFLPQDVHQEQLLALPEVLELSARHDMGAIHALNTLALPIHAAKIPTSHSNNQDGKASAPTSGGGGKTRHHDLPVDADDKRRSGFIVYGIRLLALLQATKHTELESDRNSLLWKRTAHTGWLSNPHFEQEGGDDAEVEEEENEEASHRAVVQMLYSDIEMAPESETLLLADVRASNVLNTKDWKMWDFSCCYDILRNKIMSGSALQLVNGKTKFIKRLLSFLNPYKHFFADLAWTAENSIYIRMAFELVQKIVTLSTKTQLAQMQFFVELIGNVFSSFFEELAPPTGDAAGIPGGFLNNESKITTWRILKTSRAFSKQSLTHTCSILYFDIFKVLSQNKQAHFLFDNFEFFPKLSAVLYSKVPEEIKISKEGIMKHVLRSFDYAIHENARDVLNGSIAANSHCCTVAYRLQVISVLRLLLRSQIAAGKAGPTLVLDFGWCMPLIIAQLTYSEGNVSLSSLALLEEVCADEDLLELYISLKPPLLHTLGFPPVIVQQLQLKILRSKVGAAQVLAADDGTYVQNLLKLWHDKAIFQYASTVENSLFAALNGNSRGATTGQTDVSCISSYRSPSDNYYFERLHALPWESDLQVEMPNKKSVALLTEAILYTGYTLAHVPKSKAKYKGVESQVGKDRELSTYVIFTVVNGRGDPEPYKVPVAATLKVRPVIAGYSKTQKMENRSIFVSKDASALCKPSDRSSIGDTGLVEKGDGIIWHFRREVKTNTAYLEEIWFELPVFSSSPAGLTLGPHLYGALANTREGCAALQESGHVSEFVQRVMDEKAAFSITKRGCLWALAMVGATKNGMRFLQAQHPEFLPFISKQAKTASILSMRGTCFYVLGLFSCTTVGQALLDSNGWTFSPSPATGIVVPKQLKQVLSVEPCTVGRSWTTCESNVYGISEVQRINSSGNKKEAKPLPVQKSAEYAPKLMRAWAVLGYVSNLCNHVTQKQSLHALQLMKKQEPDLFASAVLMFECYRLLSGYQYQLPARRFILGELFNHVVFDQYTMQVFNTQLDLPTTQRDVLGRVKLELEYFNSLRVAAAKTPAGQSKKKPHRTATTTATTTTTTGGHQKPKLKPAAQR